MRKSSLNSLLLIAALTSVSTQSHASYVDPKPTGRDALTPDEQKKKLSKADKKRQKKMERRAKVEHGDLYLPQPTIHERDKNYDNVYGEERSIKPIDTSRSMREYCHKPEDFS